MVLAAATTELRRRTMKLIEWPEVRLTGKVPHLCIAADKMKSKREFVVYLTVELTAALESKARHAGAVGRVFLSVPTTTQFRNDVKRADGWLRGRSDGELRAYGFTPDQRRSGVREQDDAGRTFTFHSLRYFGSNWRLRLGWTKRERMIAADHSDPAMTDKYTDPDVAREHDPERLAVMEKTAALPPILPTTSPPLAVSHCNVAKGRYTEPATSEPETAMRMTDHENSAARPSRKGPDDVAVALRPALGEPHSSRAESSEKKRVKGLEPFASIDPRSRVLRLLTAVVRLAREAGR